MPANAGRPPSRESLMQKRIAYLDVAKAIAIVAVLLGHVGGAPDVVGSLCYSFHMPLFFSV